MARETDRTAANNADDTALSLARLDTLARVLDSAVTIPGTSVRIGIDALIGIVPVVGDLVSSAVSSYLIYEAHRLGASKWVIARMAANTTLDTIVGFVPVLGDTFDLLYRSNTKNIALLKAHLEQRGARVSNVADKHGPVIEGEVVGRG